MSLPRIFTLLEVHGVGCLTTLLPLAPLTFRLLSMGKAYLVGGYLGRVEHPPPHMVEVFEFDVNGNNGEGSWREMPPLPAGRGAGAAFYLESMDTIVYTLGKGLDNVWL